MQAATKTGMQESDMEWIQSLNHTQTHKHTVRPMQLKKREEKGDKGWSLSPGSVSDTEGYNSLHFREAVQAILTSLRLKREE